MHQPTIMESDEIFELYTKMMEEDFAFNSNLYQKRTNNEKSVFVNVTNKYEKFA
jgi:hypothetical protein